MASNELRIINPYTESTEFSVPLTGADGVDRIVQRARGAFADWRRTAVSDRVALCRRFVEEFEKRADAIAQDVTVQMGKPLSQAKGEVSGLVERCDYMIGIAEDALADEILPEKPGFARAIRHEPRGVVLDIAAWNYPLLIAVNVVVPGVLAGNAIIIKHSSKTPRCADAFVDAFAAAGSPEHLVQAVAMNHETTAAMIQHSGVDHVSFTGSVSGGREVTHSAAGRFIDVGLELGGKDPAYVCADAGVDFAAEQCADGAFYNAGQSCCAIERIYVDQAVYGAFVDAFADRVRANRLGDPRDDGTSIGPLASRSARAFLSQQVQDAVAAGGRLVVSPDTFDVPGTGWFCAPAVVADAPQNSSLMQEESFGPVIGILPVSGEEEAIAMMNDSPYGLTASIWTQDVERAQRVGARVETGTFFMNRCDYLDPALPWTGVKDTGRGATLSRYGFDHLTRLKSMHFRTDIPA